MIAPFLADRKSFLSEVVRVERGLVGTANFHLTADSATWVRFLRKETNLLWAVLRVRLRWKRSPRLLRTFADCFTT